jgi:hypothetical protein
LSYDAYIHMFFADHYRRTWWELWEPRWYTGFTVTSYPPLVHQIIAVLSHFLGLEGAWSVVLLSTLTGLPFGVYAFSLGFVGRRAAGYAALITAILPSVALTAHSFGQLPTLLGILGALFGLAILGDYLHYGRKRDGLLVVMTTALIAATHHGTLLFLPWGVVAICAHLVLTRQVSWIVLIRRTSFYGVFAAAGILIVIWPFWQWGLNQTMQAPIDHASRHHFLEDQGASFMFFWPMYGPLVLVIPWLLKPAPKPRRVAIFALFFLMFMQGLGGTTPLPRWLYGRQWEWLTYDRFSLWASITLTPMLGVFICAVSRQNRRAGRQIRLGGMIMIGLTTLYAAFFARIRPTQPAPLDLQPVVEFLATDDHSRWRYLTFGFGDQLARLSSLTDTTTLDGSYHTARTLPVLRASGIGQIDSVYWTLQGLNALPPILDAAKSLGVRWTFVNLHAYEGVPVQDLLTQHGWKRVGALSVSIEVWEDSSAVRPEVAAPVSTDRTAALSWGIMPISALLGTIILAWLRREGISQPTRQ